MEKKEGMLTPEQVGSSVPLTIYVYAQYKAYTTMLEAGAISEDAREVVQEIADDLIELIPTDVLADIAELEFQELFSERDEERMTCPACGVDTTVIGGGECPRCSEIR